MTGDLLIQSDDFRRSEEDLLADMRQLSEDFQELYSEAIDEDMEEGKYRDINYEETLIWHEYG
jgi:hypothetical protein